MSASRQDRDRMLDQREARKSDQKTTAATVSELEAALDGEVKCLIGLIDERVLQYTLEQRKALVACVALLDAQWPDALDLVESVRTLLFRVRLMAYLGRDWLERDNAQFARSADFKN